MVKKLSKRPTSKQLEDLWKLCVKERAGWRCEYCHTDQGPMHPHHIAAKSSIALRTALENGVCLCLKHHLYGAHAGRGCDPIAQEIRAYAIHLRGITEEHLKMLRNNVGLVDKFALKMILEEKLKQFRDQNNNQIIGARR